MESLFAILREWLKPSARAGLVLALFGIFAYWLSANQKIQTDPLDGGSISLLLIAFGLAVLLAVGIVEIVKAIAPTIRHHGKRSVQRREAAANVKLLDRAERQFLVEVMRQGDRRFRSKDHRVNELARLRIVEYVDVYSHNSLYEIAPSVWKERSEIMSDVRSFIDQSPSRQDKLRSPF